MSAVFRIPLEPSTSDQVFEVELAGNPYKMRVTWNEREAYWSLSISTLADEPLLTNVRLVSNYPLLAAYADLRLPLGDLFLLRDSGLDELPNYDTLGINFNLYHYAPDEVPAVSALTRLTAGGWEL